MRDTRESQLAHIKDEPPPLSPAPLTPATPSSLDPFFSREPSSMHISASLPPDTQKFLRFAGMGEMGGERGGEGGRWGGKGGEEGGGRGRKGPEVRFPPPPPAPASYLGLHRRRTAPLGEGPAGGAGGHRWPPPVPLRSVRPRRAPGPVAPLPRILRVAVPLRES